MVKAGRFDGFGSVLEMLSMMDAPEREKLMAQILEKDPVMAMKLEENLVLFEDLQFLADRGLEKVLREVQTPRLVLALRTASPELIEAVKVSISERAGKILDLELASQGQQRRSDVRTAQKEIVAVAKQMLASGEIALTRRTPRRPQTPQR